MVKRFMHIRDIYEKNKDLSLSDALGIVGSEDILTEVLSSFCSSAEENVEEIERCMDEKDYGNYTIKVHALKSTAKTIGAGNLSDTAKMLESCGKKAMENDLSSKMEIIRRTPQCMAMYLKLSCIFSGLFHTDDRDMEKPDVPPEFLREFYASAFVFSENFDSDALEELVGKMDSYNLPETERERYEEFKKAFLDSDWELMSELSR